MNKKRIYKIGDVLEFFLNIGFFFFTTLLFLVLKMFALGYDKVENYFTEFGKVIFNALFLITFLFILLYVFIEWFKRISKNQYYYKIYFKWFLPPSIVLIVIFELFLIR